MKIPNLLTQPLKERRNDDLKYLKRLCDIYYNSPPVTIDDIRNAHIEEVLLVYVDRDPNVRSMEVFEYLDIYPVGMMSTSDMDTLL
jgi:hypothetical protein